MNFNKDNEQKLVNNRHKENTQDPGNKLRQILHGEQWLVTGTETEKRWSWRSVTGPTGLWSVTTVALISPGYQCGPLIGAETELRLTYVVMLTYISYWQSHWYGGITGSHSLMGHLNLNWGTKTRFKCPSVGWKQIIYVRCKSVKVSREIRNVIFCSLWLGVSGWCPMVIQLF